jgi:hypothetical protein
MKFSIFSKHLLLVGAGSFVAVLAASLAGCDTGNEGDRCNPDLSHNECNSGLVCTQPTDCPENYCCPTDVTSSSNSYCQPGCAGGAFSIAVAEFSGTCSTSTPSPLCDCFEPGTPVFQPGTLLPPDAGPYCGCFTLADPLPCFDAGASGGDASGGGNEAAPGDAGTGG